MIKGFLGFAEENREFWLVFVTLWGEMMQSGKAVISPLSEPRNADLATALE